MDLFFGTTEEQLASYACVLNRVPDWILRAVSIAQPSGERSAEEALAGLCQGMHLQRLKG